MIRITQSIIKKRKDGIYLTSTLVDENANMSTEIWYRTTEEYAPYLNDESADAFVLLALLPAIYSHQDIEVKGTLSEKLYYQLSTIGIYILTKIFYPSQIESTITISCERIRKPEIKKENPSLLVVVVHLGVTLFLRLNDISSSPPTYTYGRFTIILHKIISIDTPYLF